MSYTTNASIVPAANRGATLSTPNGNFSTHPGRAGTAGHMPRGIAQSLVYGDIFGPARRVEQVIYSYSTPIAFKIDGVWIVPDVTYSATTSTKHAVHLYKLGGGRIESVPWDASADEIERVIAGQQRYVRPRTRHGIGSYVPGPNYTEGN